MKNQKEEEMTTGELRIELRQVRESVGDILNDYEQTAETLDAVTAEVSGLEATDHASNVQALKSDLLNALQNDTDSINPPWEREGYDSKQAWLNDQ